MPQQASERSPNASPRGAKDTAAAARKTIVEKKIRVFCLDAFGIASAEATDPELRYRMQGNAFMGSFFALSPLLERHTLDETALFDGIKKQL